MRVFLIILLLGAVLGLFQNCGKFQTLVTEVQFVNSSGSSLGIDIPSGASPYVRDEFGRYGRNDGSGSDHAENAGIASFYSGIIEGPLLIGDIGKNWGYGEAASIPQLGGKLDMGHLAATIASLIGAPSPVTARSSVIGIQGGKVVSLIGTSKQV